MENKKSVVISLAAAFLILIVSICVAFFFYSDDDISLSGETETAISENAKEIISEEKALQPETEKMINGTETAE